jgi:predicted AlkP superfamily pyrophosphatase or phosphodiesterase
MKHLRILPLRLRGFLLILGLVLLSFRVMSAVPDHHVVIITIDGFPAYLFSDPLTPIPTIRQLAAEGAVAEGMRVSNPSVTWPNHTTLVTGVHAEKHSVLYNGILNRAGAGLPVAVDPKRDKSELVSVPTLYDLLQKAGYRTAGINWPCTRNSGTLDDDFPDSPDPLLHTTSRLKQELVAHGILPNAIDATFRALTGPARDDIWTRAAGQVIRERKPHLLLFHLLNTDGTHHRYGAATPASYTALALADGYIRELLKALEAAGVREKTTIFLVADHGFANATKLLYPNALLRRAGLLETGPTGQITKARVQVISEGGTGMIYLNNPETRIADLQKTLELFSGQEGVAELIQPGQYARHAFPSPEKNRGMADLVMAAKDGYAVSGSATGDVFVQPVSGNTNLGYHGYLANNPKMNAVFIVSGRGIKRGLKMGIVDNIDVAPTAAHLLGQKLPGADGKILTEMLATP